MIQSLHEFSKSWIAKGFLIIVAVSFGIFFGQSQFFSRHDPNAIAAEIGDQVIGRETLHLEMQKRIAQIQNQTGQSLDMAQIQALNLPRMVLENIIQSSLLSQEAEKLKLHVSDEAVIATLQKIPAFQDEQGYFSKKIFQIVLQNNGLTEKMFVEDIRQDLLREQLLDAIKVGVTIPDVMVENLFNAEFQTRQAAMVTFKPESMPQPKTPDTATLEAYYTAHKDQFISPEIRSFTTLLVSTKDIAKGITPSDADVEAEYNAKKDHYQNKPFADVKDQVIRDLQNQQAADKIYELTQNLDDALAGGATLEEIAKTHALQIVKVEGVDGQGTTLAGVPSPAFQGHEMLKGALLSTAFATEDGQDSNFVEGPDGLYYIVRVDEMKPSQAQDFKEAQARVTKAWTLEQQIQEAVTRAKALTAEINAGAKKPAMLELLPNLVLAEGNSTIPENIQEVIFTLALGKAGLAPVKDGVAVVVLNNVIAPSDKIKAEKFAAYKDELKKRLASDVVNSFIDSLRIQFPVRINQNALKMLMQGNE